MYIKRHGFETQLDLKFFLSHIKNSKIYNKKIFNINFSTQQVIITSNLTTRSLLHIISAMSILL